MHYTTVNFPKIETILAQPKCHIAHAWELRFLKQHTCEKKTSYKYLSGAKISIGGKLKIYVLSS